MIGKRLQLQMIIASAALWIAGPIAAAAPPSRDKGQPAPKQKPAATKRAGSGSFSQAKQLPPATDRQPKTVQTPPAEPRDPALLDDYAIASWIIADLEVLVAVEELAGDRCQDPEVKQFAQELLADHRRLIARLHEKGLGVDIGKKAKGDEPDDVTHRPKSEVLHQRWIGPVPLKQRLGESLATALMRELKRDDVDSFDIAYLSYTTLAHVQLLSTMNVLQLHTSPSFAEEIALGAADSRRHLERARELLREVD